MAYIHGLSTAKRANTSSSVAPGIATPVPRGWRQRGLRNAAAVEADADDGMDAQLATAHCRACLAALPHWRRHSAASSTLSAGTGATGMGTLLPDAGRTSSFGMARISRICCSRHQRWTGYMAFPCTARRRLVAAAYGRQTAAAAGGGTVCRDGSGGGANRLQTTCVVRWRQMSGCTAVSHAYFLAGRRLQDLLPFTCAPPSPALRAVFSPLFLFPLYLSCAGTVSLCRLGRCSHRIPLKRRKAGLEQMTRRGAAGAVTPSWRCTSLREKSMLQHCGHAHEPATMFFLKHYLCTYHRLLSSLNFLPLPSCCILGLS